MCLVGRLKCKDLLSLVLEGEGLGASALSVVGVAGLGALEPAGPHPGLWELTGPPGLTEGPEETDAALLISFLLSTASWHPQKTHSCS